MSITKDKIQKVFYWGILLIIILGVGVYYFKIKNNESGISSPESQTFPSEKAETFNISGGEEFPRFRKQLIVDPYSVKDGDEQVFSVWAEDPNGIKSVTATISTDTTTQIKEMVLVEGDEKEGRWFTSWIAADIGNKLRYSTSFKATNQSDVETNMTVFWKSLENEL